MSGVTEHCYEIGLRIYHTNWRCCTLAYGSELCTLTYFLFLFIFTHVGYQIQLISSCAQQYSCSRVHLEFVRNRDIVTLSELKNPLLCNKFHWFHKQCSDCSAIFLFLSTACYRLDSASGQPAQWRSF